MKKKGYLALIFTILDLLERHEISKASSFINLPLSPDREDCGYSVKVSFGFGIMVLSYLWVPSSAIPPVQELMNLLHALTICS
jgi:hypothetical protein